MNKSRTLVILSPAFAEQESDSWLPGQEGFIRMLNKIYPKLKIIILTFHFPLVSEKKYSWHGNEVIAFNGNMRGGWQSVKRWQQVWSTLKTLSKTYPLVGIFSFFCSECAFVGHYFSRLHHLPHYIWVLGQDAKADNKQVKRIRPAADELITISDFLVREFEHNHHIKPQHVIPIGIDATQFPAIHNERTIDILGVGSLIKLKQFDVFLDVVQAITEKLPHLKVMLCGDGPEEPFIRNKIVALQLQDKITLAGKLPQPEVISLMQRSKILLHPSAYEGFGMVCAEALYAGAHVVSFCKPMDRDVSHWHTVENVPEMIKQTLALLQLESLADHPVMTFAMEDTAKQIMQRFGYKESSIS